MKQGTWSHSGIATYFYICNSSIMFVYYSNFPCKEKSYCFFRCFSTIINFLVVSHLVCACRGAVLGSEIRSAQHTHLLAASANARLLRQYFSSTKGRARDAACSHCNVLVLYRTCTILYDMCLMDAGRIFDRILF